MSGGEQGRMAVGFLRPMVARQVEPELLRKMGATVDGSEGWVMADGFRECTGWVGAQ